MKITDKKKPIPTIPEGVWESPRTDRKSAEKKRNCSTDMQGNGYPGAKKTQR